MTVSLPHQDEPVAADKPMARRWFETMDRLFRAVNGPLPARALALADLPTNPPDGWLAYCTDAGGGGVPVYARGGVWRRFDTNGVVT